jgi:hypothetical protein
MPLNECNVPKFVCSGLRPSLVPHSELHSLDGAARFVAEWLTHEVLADPMSPPAHLPSPWSVLSWQAGDAFDSAGLLASLLLGAGYNAYVVMGYAQRAVTLLDQSGKECPFLRPAFAAASDGNCSASRTCNGELVNGGGSSNRRAGSGGVGRGSGDGNGPSGGSGKVARSGSCAGPAQTEVRETKPQKYAVRPPPQLDSMFLKLHGASLATPVTETEAGGEGSSAEAVPQSATEQETLQALPAIENTTQTTTEANNRVHAWVVVLPGRREVIGASFCSGRPAVCNNQRRALYSADWHY